MKTKKKLHIINSLVLALLTTGFICCIYIISQYNLDEGSAIGIEYLAGLFLFFGLFWIFMKYGEFFIKEEKEILKKFK